MEISEKQIIEAVAIEVAIQILKLKSGEIDEADSKLLCPDKWEKILLSCGFKKGRDPIECNGWSWDFWCDYTDEFGTLYTLSGSGWYGGVKFEKKKV